MATDVVVVGGGVIGGAIAYYLRRAGADVTLLEAGRIGGTASGVAAGMLLPSGEAKASGPFFDLALRSLRLLPDLARELLDTCGIDIEYVPSGVLRTAMSEAQERDLKAALDWQRAAGLDVRWLGAEQTRSLEPELTSVLRGAIFSADEGHVRSNRLTEAFVQAAARLGAGVRLGTPAVGLSRRGHQVTGVRTPDGVVSCDHVVLAAGPWTGALTKELDIMLPVRPVKGQLLALRGVSSPLSRVVYASGIGYLVPKRDGSIIVGATQEEAGFDTGVTAQGVRTLLDRAVTILPSLANAEVVQTWAGLRPATPDGLPILGALPGWDGISVAGGHFRNGILLSAITGQLMAELITTGETSLSLEPFRVERFGSFEFRPVEIRGEALSEMILQDRE